jgi:hypothetical protein
MDTEVVRLDEPSPRSRSPYWARLYYASGVTKTKRQIPVGGQLAIAVTNTSRDGLQMDIDVGIERSDIGRIEWGGPE